MSETGLRKDLTPEEFQLFRDWIHRHSGIFLEESKMDSLRISLVTRATRFDYTDYRDYFDLLSVDEEEFKELMNLVTINETSFFRFPGQFDALRDAVIPQVVEGRRKDATKHFRVWSAGCSTGEEPYTISMTLHDSALAGFGYSYEVHGTDVSTQALEKAREAIYPEKSTANLSANVLNRFFEPVKGGHRPRAQIRKPCTFHYHNLIKEPYPLAFLSNWDVIFCRNVTIYFRMESIKRVVNNFYDALNPGGYLFIGHSETLTSVSDRFEPVEINGVFLYQKPMERRGFTFQDIVEKRQADRAKARKRFGEFLESIEPKRAEKEPADPTPQTDVPDGHLSVGDRAGLLAQAHALLEQADARGALKVADEILDANPGDIDGHVVAAFALADLGDPAAAASQAKEALTLNPLAAPARYILGVIKQQQGDIEGALQEFKRTIYIDRDFVMAHFAAANLYRQRGMTADARRGYENALRSMHAQPEGSWRAFLGGFRPDLLAKICERSLVECGKDG